MAADAKTREKWEDRVATYQSSGLSVSAWCETHDLKPHQLRYWLHKLKVEKTSNPLPAQWLSVDVHGLKPTPAEQSPLVVRIGHATIEIRPGCDRQLLADVVSTLAALC